MRVYIDFDDVLVNTHATIMKLKDHNQTDKEYINSCNWEHLLNKVDVINDSLKYLKTTKLDVYLLSKISTLNEGIAKIKYLRKNNVDIDIHLVPNILRKDDIVCAKDNILIDDKIYNLDNWTSKGGIGIFFSQDNDDMDIYGRVNTKYYKISDLSILSSVKKIDMLL